MSYKSIISVIISAGLLFFSSCKNNDPNPQTELLQLNSIKVGILPISLAGTTVGIPVNQPFTISFSSPINTATVPSSISIKSGSSVVTSQITFADNNQTVLITPDQTLANNTSYTVVITSELTGANGQKFPGVQIAFKTETSPILLTSLSIGGKSITTSDRVIDINQDLSIVVTFSVPVNPESFNASTVTLGGPDFSPLNFTFSNDNKTVTITRPKPLIYLTKYSIAISSDVKGAGGEAFTGRTQIFYSTLGNHTSGFAALSDDQLLDLVESQTIKYFYDFGHPVSGLARERNTSGDVVTSGGSGFGLMAMIVGIERGFIPRNDGVARFNKIITFLEKADRFHGAWPHWIDGNSGHVIPFSTNDNGADLVETSFLTQGLITVRQYLKPADTVGNNLINRITGLYNGIEWDWFRRDNQNVLYWHWSPDKAWIMNFPLSGYFEEQVTYFLAASSQTHGIPKVVYTNGFGRNGGIKTGNTYTYNGESHVLPLGTPSPLFWVQYSYLGLNPHFSDDFADYWTQNVNATLINHAYCAENPKKYVGYSDSCWGLTASDNPTGYDAQSPANDNGTITPTAALSSFPYAPEQSMKALKFFYYTVGDRLWGNYGFYDAINFTQGWTANSTLAIDQGPIVVMIENYRTQLLWNLFESAPEVQAGKTQLGFH